MAAILEDAIRTPLLISHDLKPNHQAFINSTTPQLHVDPC